MEVEALNVAGAQVGDRIVLHIETSSLLKASFLLYVFPILCMLAGALVGHHGAEQLQLDPSVVSLVLGLLGFGLAFVIVRRRQQAMARTDAYKPKVIRIVQRAPQNELRPAPLHQG
jgi:sigma-E factor negative regulatory protein RseC